MTGHRYSTQDASNNLMLNTVIDDFYLLFMSIARLWTVGRGSGRKRHRHGEKTCTPDRTDPAKFTSELNP